MTQASPAKQRNTPDVVALARRSLVGVRGLSKGGTGWVVLGNGLVMTSHEAVGYQSEVTLDLLDSARRIEARVIWADVARDLALVLPVERLPLPPLLPRPDLPRLGEPVLALSALPDQPCRVTSALVSAIDFRIGPLRCFELDAAVASGGGPILDLDGRVIGVGGLDLPRGTRRRAEPLAAGPARSLAIPIAALQRALAAVDVPAEQFADRSPTYRCPACAEPFQAREERCLACGRLLPHGWELADTERGAALSGAERLMRDLLAELGTVASAVRTGPRSFRLATPHDGAASQIDLDLDEDGHTVRAKLPLLRVPVAHQEPFYRFLLTLNDQTIGGQRFFVEGDTVYLSFIEPTALVRPGEGSVRLTDLVREGERYKKALAGAFDAVAP
jgi:hypothetical protein